MTLFVLRSTFAIKNIFFIDILLIYAYISKNFLQQPPSSLPPQLQHPPQPPPPQQQQQQPQVNISPILYDKWNLIEVFHNNANSAQITKIALKKCLDFFGQRR